MSAIICPKCKELMPNNQDKCSNCGFRFYWPVRRSIRVMAMVLGILTVIDLILGFSHYAWWALCYRFSVACYLAYIALTGRS